MGSSSTPKKGPPYSAKADATATIATGSGAGGGAAADEADYLDVPLVAIVAENLSATAVGATVRVVGTEGLVNAAIGPLGRVGSAHRDKVYRGCYTVGILLLKGLTPPKATVRLRG